MSSPSDAADSVPKSGGALFSTSTNLVDGRTTLVPVTVSETVSTATATTNNAGLSQSTAPANGNTPVVTSAEGGKLNPSSSTTSTSHVASSTSITSALPSSSSKTPVGAIVGGVVGGVVFIALLGLIVFFVLRKRRSKSAPHDFSKETGSETYEASTVHPPKPTETRGTDISATGPSVTARTTPVAGLPTENAGTAGVVGDARSGSRADERPQETHFTSELDSRQVDADGVSVRSASPDIPADDDDLGLGRSGTASQRPTRLRGRRGQDTEGPAL